MKAMPTAAEIAEPLVPPDAILENRVHGSLVGAGLVGHPPAGDQSVKATVQVMREVREREDAELQAFCDLLADHFGVPDLLDPRHRLRIKTAWIDIRRLAHQLRVETERRCRNEPAASR